MRLYLMTFLLVISCSEATNPFGYLVTDASQSSPDSLIYEAEYELDRGEYDKAIALGEKAYAQDPGSEKGAIVLGYAYMAKAGIDPFRLAEKLQSQGTTKATAAEPASDLSNPLDPLKTLLGLDSETLTAITLSGNKVTLADGTVVLGAPTTGIFRNYPVLFPKTAIEARASGGDALASLARAVTIICPFVSEDAKVLSPVADPRHTPEACPPANKILEFSGKSHYIWAFAHLIEAIAFNSVVLYDPSGAGANIVRRSDALQSSSTGAIGDYIKGIKELGTSVDIILPTAPDKTAGSMLSGMVNDLQATSRGFDLLPGMPTSMTKSIKEALTKLDEQTAKIKSAGVANEAQASSAALKDTLTAALGEKLETQINSLSSQGSLSTAQLSDVCKAYKNISTTTLDVCTKN